MIGFGGLILDFREWIAPKIAMLQRATFGRAGEVLASKATSKGLIAPGIGFMLIGAGMAALSIFYHRA